MANHSSTKKAIRKTAARTAINRSRRSRIRTYIKRVLVAVESGSYEAAQAALIEAQSEIMRGVTHKVIDKNTASRKVSRLNKKVKAIAGGVSPVKTAASIAKTVKPTSAKATTAKKTAKASAEDSATKKSATTKKATTTKTKE